MKFIDIDSVLYYYTVPTRANLFDTETAFMHRERKMFDISPAKVLIITLFLELRREIEIDDAL